MSRTIAGARLYVTQQGDMVDAICRREYGTEVATTEQVYAANPGLAALGPVLEEGVTVLLPGLGPQNPKRLRTVNLWDKP